MSAPLTTQAQLRDAIHTEGLTFKCGDCGKIKPVQTNGGTDLEMQVSEVQI